MRSLRSYLFAPGNNERLLGKVFTAGADAVILDLEDAVPESEKNHARTCVREALAREASQAGSVPAFVRINSLVSGHWRADIDAVIGPGVAGVRVPKVEDVESLCRLDDALRGRESSLGLAPGSIGVVATIETARGLARLDSVSRGPRLLGFAFGTADFCADIGADSADDAPTLFARSTMVVASRDRRLAPPIASVYTRLNDDQGLLADTIRQKALGFFGRSAIHPRQIPIIHEAFDPTAAEVERAGRQNAAYEAAEEKGRGTLQTGGDFVDLAVVRRARAVLHLHETARPGAAEKDPR